MQSKDAPPSRRQIVVGALGVALVGEVIGLPRSRASDINMDAVAEAYLDDALDLGMTFIVGPDGALWRSMSIDGTEDEFAARDRHTRKLTERRGLRDAVIRVAVKSPLRAC